MGELGRDPALMDDLLADPVRLVLVEPGGGQHLLDGDVAVQQPIGREPDRAHTAATEFRLQAVAAGHQIVRADDGTGTIDHGARLAEFRGSWPDSDREFAVVTVVTAAAGRAAAVRARQISGAGFYSAAFERIFETDR